MPAIIRVVDGRTVIKVGENTAMAVAAASLAEQYANDANLSADAAALAAAAVGVYGTTAEGIGATTNGQSFYVTDGTDFALYENNAGVADLVILLPTITAVNARVPYAELASTAPGEGAALVGTTDGQTAQVKFDALDKSPLQKPLVVVASGQSNMMGVGTGGTFYVNENVQVWNPNNAGADKFQTLDLATAFTMACGGGFGGGGKNNLAAAFCHRLHQETGRPVYLIIEALGAQAIAPGWLDASNTVWDDLDTQVTAALAALGIDTIDVFIWHQGEGDYGVSTDPATYWDRLNNQFIEDTLKAASWWGDETPFIAGEMALRVAAQNRQIRRLNYDGASNGVAVSSAGIPMHDAVHFSGAGLFEMGYKRYYQAYLSGHTALAKEGIQESAYSVTAPSVSFIGLTTNPTVTISSVTGQIVQQGSVVHYKISFAISDYAGDGSGLLRLQINTMPIPRGSARHPGVVGPSPGLLDADSVIPIGGSPQLGFFNNIGSARTPTQALNPSGGLINLSGTYFTDAP